MNSSNNQNANGNSNDANKKEEFRRYLEKTGVLDALTKVLVGLYEEPERPVHAVEYIRRYLGASNHSGVDMEGLQRENHELKLRLEKMQKQLQQQQQFSKTKPTPSGAASSAPTTVASISAASQHPPSATPASTKGSTGGHGNTKKTSNPPASISSVPAPAPQQKSQNAPKK